MKSVGRLLAPLPYTSTTLVPVNVDVAAYWAFQSFTARWQASEAGSPWALVVTMVFGGAVGTSP